MPTSSAPQIGGGEEDGPDKFFIVSHRRADGAVTLFTIESSWTPVHEFKSPPELGSDGSHLSAGRAGLCLIRPREYRMTGIMAHFKTLTIPSSSNRATRPALTIRCTGEKLRPRWLRSHAVHPYRR